MEFFAQLLFLWDYDPAYIKIKQGSEMFLKKRSPVTRIKKLSAVGDKREKASIFRFPTSFKLYFFLSPTSEFATR